jgi:hypothetical protein
MNKAIVLYKLTKLLLFGGINMKNWKTTVAGLIAAAGQILGIFGVPVEVGNAVSIVGLFILGLFAKDSNVTGGKITQ